MATPPHLKIPLSFERRPDVRLLARRLGSDPVFCGGDCHNGTDAKWIIAATTVAFALWREWATAGEAWRPLAHPYPSQREGGWPREELVFLIESGCGWHLEPGRMIEAAIDAGLLLVQRKGSVDGLALNDFAKFNEHLLPGYVSMHQRGQAASVEAKHRRRDGESARKQRELLESPQSLLDLDAVEATPEEIETAITLILRIDRACGRAARLSAEYDAAMIEDATRIGRRFTDGQILAALDWLVESRDDPAVVKRTQDILSRFVEYVPQETSEGDDE